MSTINNFSCFSRCSYQPCFNRPPVAYRDSMLVRSVESAEKQMFVQNIKTLNRAINKIQRELETISGDIINTPTKNICQPKKSACPVLLTKSEESAFWFNQCCKISTLNARLNILEPIAENLIPEFFAQPNRKCLYSTCQKLEATKKRVNALYKAVFN